MSDIKLVVSDLDGTLLDSRKRLPDECIEVFGKLSALGVKTAIVTSRPERSAKCFADALGCSAAAYNAGAEVFIGGVKAFSSALSDVFIKDFTSALVRDYPDISIGAEACGAFYANHSMKEMWREDESIRCDFPKFPLACADKLLIKTARGMDPAIAASYALDYRIHAESAHGTVIVTNADASKALAVKRIAEAFGISLSETAAFGDDLGDLETLRLVGHPYCVENAHPMLKASAATVASNDSHGVAKELYKLFFGG